MKTTNKKDSEKLVEKKLREGVEKKLGGLCIKLQCDFFIGLPDRLVLLPGGVIIFVELKTTGQKPRPIQVLVHNKLRALGFDVRVIDSLEGVEQFIDEHVDNQ